MLLARVSEGGKRRIAPAGQQCVALRRRRLRSLSQPRIECSCAFQCLGPKVGAQIVKAHPAGHNQYALVSQRSQSPSCRKMQSRVK